MAVSPSRVFTVSWRVSVSPAAISTQWARSTPSQAEDFGPSPSSDLQATARTRSRERDTAPPRTPVPYPAVARSELQADVHPELRRVDPAELGDHRKHVLVRPELE